METLGIYAPRLVTKRQSFVSGHRACSGCAEVLAVKLVMKALGRNVIVAMSTGYSSEANIKCCSIATHSHHLGIKCGICSLFCPEDCIGQNGDGYFEADLYYCKGCGICARECWTQAITMVEETKE